MDANDIPYDEDDIIELRGRERREHLHKQPSHLMSYPLGMAHKRGYSREFTPRTDRRIKIEIDRVPPSIADALRAKCKRDGVSVRALTLRLWKDWIEQ